MRSFTYRALYLSQLLLSLVAVGSGGSYALAAARALKRHSQLSAVDIVRAALGIAAEICIYTNDRVTVLELPE